MAAAMATDPQAQARWNVLPTSLINMLNPFANTNDDVDNKHNAVSEQPKDLQLKRPILSTIPLKVGDGGPPSPSKSSASIMFEEPDTRTNSEDGSREGSVDGRRRSKRSIRPKTRFSICHPPPESTVRSRLHRRPRSLLQLHKLTANARPRPALEAIPSANFSLSLQRAVTRVFKTRHATCQNDVVVLKAEKYHIDDVDQEQDVVGLICKGRKDEDKNIGGRPTIHMASGPTWEAIVMPNGGYEFVSTDEHGLELKVRWVPKKTKDGKAAVKHGKRRFNFSTISANSRRHPVIANLSGSGLEINDSYKVPEPAAFTPLSSPAKDSILEEAADDEEDGSLRNDTSDQLREIITMTAIWVNFKEGWSPSVKYDEKDTFSPRSPSRTGTEFTSISTPPGSPAQLPAEKRSSIRSIGSGIIRRASVMSRSNRSSIISVPEEEEPSNDAPSRSASIAKSTGRSRADSSSTVLVHRAASNRRKNNQQANGWRPDHLLTAQDPLQENSREDLSRDFSTPSRKAGSSPLAGAEMDGDTESAKPEAGRDSDEERSGAETPAATATPTRKPQHSRRSSRVPSDEVDTTPTKPVHRETSRSASDSSAAGTKTFVSKKSKRRSFGLRRLLCGSGQHDV